MRALGFEVKKADVLKIMKDYDRESTGKISFDDFNEVSKYSNICIYWEFQARKGYLLWQIKTTSPLISTFSDRLDA